MLSKVIKIGNSKGVRIPAYILKECNIDNKIELEVKDGKLIICAADKPRKNWDEKFREMHRSGHDILLIDENVGIETEDWKW